MSAHKSYATIARQILRRIYHPNLSDLPSPAVREASQGYAPVPVTERLAQCIWFDQRLKHDTLKLTDGRAVKIIDPGAWNLEAGPDFRRATVQIEDSQPLSGDVELHLFARDWHDHGHMRDTNYNNVVLHVVAWEDGSERLARTADGRTLPQLVLMPHLDSPLEELYDSIDIDSYPYSAHNHTGRCEAILKTMSAESLSALLADAGNERLEAKARRVVRRAKHAGLEQAFYEGFMEALGYKGNKMPFRLLAQRFPLETMRELHSRSRAETQMRLEAVLLGLGGLLPERETKSWDTISKQRAKALWDYWWKQRASFEDAPLSRAEWNFASLRPANHPQRRLAGAAAFLAANSQPLAAAANLIASEEDPHRVLRRLEEWLAAAGADEFWQTHYRLGSRPQSKSCAIFGAQRVAEIVMNAVLPAILARMMVADKEKSGFERAELGERARRIYALMPRQSAHSVERYMFSRLLVGRGEKPSVLLPSARHQQGLIQIFQDFCLNNASNCQDCQFPELLQQWAR